MSAPASEPEKVRNVGARARAGTAGGAPGAGGDLGAFGAFGATRAARARLRHASQDGRQNKTLVFRSKVTTGGGHRARTEPRDDSACTRSRGICQASRYVCQGRYLRDRCSGGTRQCCVPGDPEPDRSPALIQINSLSLSLPVSLSTCLCFSLLLPRTLSFH